MVFDQWMYAAYGNNLLLLIHLKNCESSILSLPNQNSIF